MNDDLAARRRSPAWVRAMSDQAVHALAGRLRRGSFYTAEFSPRQDWLLDCTLSELDYRRRRDQRDGIKPCSCELCCGPFDDTPT